MKYLCRLVFSGVAISFLFFTATMARAQIAGQIDADIHHKFIVGDATLPPGRYIFHMLQGSDQSLMVATRADGNAGAQFMVRGAIDPHTPKHTEFVFERYDDKEFLTHIFEIGEKDGETVVEPSRIEARLQKLGKVPVEDTEVEP